ncbi:MAG TPA: gliding motility-associated C-terminal domain-containing protein [Puia sp.]|nr:gliding motility-associated C-terminal domain-containing protein [Puia sp.]
MDRFTVIILYTPYIPWARPVKLAVLAFLLVLPGGFSYGYDLSGPIVTATGVGTTCGLSNGAISATADGGTPPYAWSLNGGNFQPDGTFTGLGAGAYTVTVKDALSQTNSMGLMLTNAFTPPSFSFTATYVSSCSSSDATIHVIGSGGAPPYQFGTDNISFSDQTDFINLPAGAYTLFERDANGCTTAKVVSVVNICPFLFNYTSGNPGCSNNNGFISVNPYGGVEPYSFSLNGGPVRSNGTYTQLPAGIYVVVMKDAAGSATTWGFSLFTECSFFVSSLIKKADCGRSDGSVTALARGGNPPFTYSIDGINFLPGNIFSGLPAGPYKISIKDAGGALADQAVNIETDNTVKLEAGADITICLGSSAVLASSSNGSAFSWSPAAGLSDPAILNPSASPSVTTKYYLTASADGCSKTDSLTVKVNPFPSVFAGNDTSVTIGQPLQLHAMDIGNSGFTQYSWSPTEGLSNPSIANPIALPGQTINYTVTASIGGATCEADASIGVKVFRNGPDIYVPGAFTPDGNGRNDLFRAIPVGIREFTYFVVFNRRGQQVFRTSDPAQGWDGRINGSPQITGTYIWAAAGVDYQGRRIDRKGTVVLVR